ncbi:MAG: pyridoxamine 5'-phosphate oxidase family protein, partial [Candidatus Eremiobacteraeota bacterium]|nr:pyridoxamine 5'-phosphate oxidase family protein [Candidatus Eremiobacteraeota bacterium]
AERVVTDFIDDEDKQLIESVDMFFLATVDDEGRPNCSYKGGDPGFVHVVDKRTLAFPNYDGNGMYVSMGNLQRTAHVGMLFVDWSAPRRVRVNGDATVHFDDPLLARFPEAQFVVRVAVREVFPNCPRYVHRYELVERSRFVPRAGATTPIPQWKRSELACDVLPANDPARNAQS